MPRKPKIRRGRPVLTDSKRTTPVFFRVSAAQRAELQAEADRLGLKGPNEAAKKRTFPAG